MNATNPSKPASTDHSLGFADELDQPIRYLQRTRDWYLGLGYDNPYRWAHYAEAPFTSLTKPLADTCVAIITTAAPYQPDKGDQGPGAKYNAAAKFYAVYSGDTEQTHDLRISHVAIDRKHTSMQDSQTWFALPMLKQLASEHRIGRVAPNFYGVPTNRSQRHTLEVDAPEVLNRCRQDGVEAVVLIPNCPVCHQTLSLVARHLEANGIPTVVMGCAKDIVEHCGVPRFLFSDFPLGNSAGKPHDQASQRLTLTLALQLLEHAPCARTTAQSPLRWADSPDWKLDYSNIERVSPEELVKLKEEFDRGKAIAANLREVQLEPVFKNLMGDHQAIERIFSTLGLMRQGDELMVEPLTGGVSSNIFKVSVGSTHYCLKQALPELKVAKVWLAPVDRVFAEIDWLRTVQTIVPGHVPRVIGVDETSKSFVMDYLGDHYSNWKSALLAGQIAAGVSAQVGRILGQIHAQTAHQTELAARFANDQMFYAIRLEPYLEESARQHPELAATLRQLVHVTANNRLVLIHGDVSPKNILLGPQGPVLLDAECACFGDPAFDVAFCLNHFLFKSTHRVELLSAFLQYAREFYQAYFAEVTWEPPAMLAQRVAALLPGLLLARIDGKSPIEYATEDVRVRVRALAIRFLKQDAISLSEILSQWDREFSQ